MLRNGVVLRSAIMYLAQQFGVCAEKATVASVAEADISQVGLSALIIGQRYFTIGTPTLKSPKTAINTIETVILESLRDMVYVLNAFTPVFVPTSNLMPQLNYGISGLNAIFLFHLIL